MFQFFTEVKNELLKVVWPTPRETLVYTAVVVVFSLVMAVFLGAADFGLFKLLDKLIS